MDNKVALVTGASGGIGKAIALTLAQDGWDILLHYRSNETSVNAIKAEIEVLGRNARCFKADLSDYEEAGAMVKYCTSELGSLDALVNNAGMTDDGLLLKMDGNQFSRVIDADLKSCFNCTAHASRIMMRKKHGVIVNITSVVGITGNIGQANYSAAKAGMIGLTKTCAKELARRNIRVNAIAPGFIETAMTDKLSQSIKDTLMESIALKRLGKPQDIGNMVQFLCSDKSSYITGQVLVVDGGMVI
jgi:3-oxoacyl-[acyl-carrier protein] reductase